MPTTAEIRYHLTKQPLIDGVLTWFQHQDVQPTDMFIASYPRSGSTWLRFMLCELLTGAETSFQLVDETLAHVGHHSKAPILLPNAGRLLKTHEPYREQYQRAIYIVRDVRDVISSEFIFCRRNGSMTCDFDSFFELFMQGRVNRYGAWTDHVHSWLRYQESEPDKVHLVRFEDLRRNTATVVGQCLDFLGIERTQAQIDQAVENHNLTNMQKKEDQAERFKENREGLRFITDGAVGKGKQQLSQDQTSRLINAALPLLKRLNYLEASH